MNIPSTALVALHYFPCIQYFTKFIFCQEVQIEQHEHYQKGSYRNRCHIAGVNGVLRLSIPLKSGKNQKMPIRDVRIAYDEPWQAQHWTSIKSAYGNAPYFEYYADQLQPFFQNKPTLLFDWNYELLGLMKQLIGLQTPISLTKNYEPHPIAQIDFRQSISPKQKLNSTDKQFIPQAYAQVFQEKHGFLPNLSILDLLFCAGPQSILILESSTPDLWIYSATN
ncbi:MAG: WbqC family protein [Bacteroidota bacterium]